MNGDVWQAIVMLVLIGFVAGMAGGLFGIGGAVVMIPAMTEALGPNQHTYQAAAMIVNLFVAAPAVLHHYSVGAIDRAAIWRLIPLAAGAVVVGVGLSELPVFSGDGEAYLRAMFGGFLLLISVWGILRSRQRREAGNSPATSADDPQPDSAPGWRLAAAVAVPAGLVGGALGVGGGLLAVPLQRRLLGVPWRQAIANSSTVVVATSAVGAILKNYATYVDTGGSMEPLVLAAVLIPSAATGSALGSRLVHRLPLEILRIAFLVVMMLASLRLMFTSLAAVLGS